MMQVFGNVHGSAPFCTMRATKRSQGVIGRRCCIKFKHAGCCKLLVGLVMMGLIVITKGETFVQDNTNSTACAIVPTCGANGHIRPSQPCQCACEEGWTTNPRQDILSPDKQWCNVRVELEDANSDREHNTSENVTSSPSQVHPPPNSQGNLLETALHPGER